MDDQKTIGHEKLTEASRAAVLIGSSRELLELRDAVVSHTMSGSLVEPVPIKLVSKADVMRAVSGPGQAAFVERFGR